MGAKLSEFRTRGIRVVVDTTRAAEIDFSDNYITEEDQERIARNLKHILRSEDDIIEGYLRIREIVPGWEVIFTHYSDNEFYVVLVVGYGKKGEMESAIKYLLRAGMDQLAPGANTLLQGRKRK